MSDGMANSELCCTLDAIPSSERADQSRLIGELFGRALVGRVELIDGYQFEFETGVLQDLARFVSMERLCCPFLRFRFVVEGNRIQLQITGPPGAKEVIEAELLQ